MGHAGRLNYPNNKAARKTSDARKMAALWGDAFSRDFPGGHENAYIGRLNPTHWQLAAGRRTWELVTLRGHHPNLVMGLPYCVRECLKEPELLEW